jgi:hypothetical protein
MSADRPTPSRYRRIEAGSVNKEMGKYVNMSASQVAKTLSRLKGKHSPPLDQWVEELRKT